MVIIIYIILINLIDLSKTQNNNSLNGLHFSKTVKKKEVLRFFILAINWIILKWKHQNYISIAFQLLQKIRRASK
jgi:hypothetical protein